MTNSIDAADLRDEFHWNTPAHVFSVDVDRKTELTFNSERSMLIPKVEREAMKIAFDNARKYFHTAETYAEELIVNLTKNTY